MTSNFREELPSDAIALALMAADVHFRMDTSYHRALTKHVFIEANVAEGCDKKEQIRAETKLRSEDAKHALTFIWKSSDHVTEEALLKAGYERTAVNRALNSNALATQFSISGNVTDPDAITRIRLDISRIVKAANTFGLIEFFPDPKNRNRKPFRGTKLLHRLMMSVHLRNAQLIESLNSMHHTGSKRVSR